MKRKIIKQAGQAYTITLPIEWVRKNKIDKNSEVDLIINGKSLAINSNNPVSGGNVKFHLSDLNERNIYRHIAALYAKGIDEIQLSCDKNVSSSISKILNNLLGYALVSQKENTFVIKDISPSSYENLDDIFKRVFQIIIFFYQSAFEDIFGEEKETLENLKSRDYEVNKFCLFLERAINKIAYDNPIHDRIIFTYSFELEKISDEIERLWRTNINHKVKKSPELKSLVKLSKEGLELSFDLYFSLNSEKTISLYKLREEVREKSMKIKNLNPDTMRFIRHVVKIIEDCSDLNHLTLMKKLS